MVEFSDFYMILVLALGVAIGNLASFSVMAFFAALIEKRKVKK